MSYKLQKPYTEKQRLDFIAEYGQNCNGIRSYNMSIEKTVDALYALEPWEKLVDGQVIDNSEEYEKELAKKERERLDISCLTAADVERAIYKAKGLDFDDILELVKDNSEIDLKALKIELKANHFYRGNPYVSIIGEVLGYSSEDLDYLFENKELPTLEEEDDNEMVLE